MPNEITNILNIAKPFCIEVAARLKDILADEKKQAYFYSEADLFNLAGKMLRPALVYLSVLSVEKPENGDFESIKNLPYYSALLNFATAVELLHQASIAHDDFLDNETMRRGQATTYQKFGSKTALLSGNILYLLSFQLALETLTKVQAEALVQAALMMCRGEIAQLHLFKEDGSISDELPDASEFMPGLSGMEAKQSIRSKWLYEKVIAAKTGELTAIACREAVRIAGMKEERVIDYEMLGRMIGVLYQVMDDLADQDTQGMGERYAQALFVHYMEGFKKQIEKMYENKGKQAFDDLCTYFLHTFEKLQ